MSYLSYYVKEFQESSEADHLQKVIAKFVGSFASGHKQDLQTAKRLN